MKDGYITPAEKALIHQHTPSETLALWWGKLNGWEWPDEFPDPDPPYKKGEDYNSKSRRALLMNEIKSRVGIRYLLFIWNTKERRDKMTEEEFNEWFENNEHD